MKKMNRILMACLLLAALVLAAGCAADPTPYEQNDADNCTLSVKFDANGGIFTTNTSVIVDSFDPTAYTEIALIPPDHAARGNDAFAAVKNGYFLAGWYAQRTDNGDGSFTYGQPWNFEQDVLTVEAGKNYSSAEPVLTLYAAWVPLFEVEFVDRQTGETLGSYVYDPTAGAQLKVPSWNLDTGAIEMYKFPARAGYTFDKAYYDAEGTRPVDTEALVHTGVMDAATGTAQNHAMQIYVDWMEGEWYHIYNVDQFLSNASLTGSYVIHEDLDFTDKIWPTMLMYGNFSGTIEGNGHTLRNIRIAQTNNSKVNAGLFGRLTETASVTDVTFENVTFTIEAGTRVAGASFGLLSGAVADTAQLSQVTVKNGLLQIDANAYFGTEDYVIGLVSGLGGEQVDFSDIRCAVVGESDPKLYAVSDDQGFVTVTDTPPAEEPDPTESTETE